jgi:multidrug efflux pump
VTLQFDLNRNVDAVAREVQAAINASRVDLPPRCAQSYLSQGNTSGMPVMILALTSKTKTPGQISTPCRIRCCSACRR